MGNFAAFTAHEGEEGASLEFTIKYPYVKLQVLGADDYIIYSICYTATQMKKFWKAKKHALLSRIDRQLRKVIAAYNKGKRDEGDEFRLSVEGIQDSGTARLQAQ